MFEYVIVIYAQSVVTTVIGFADENGAQQAFNNACVDNHADWAYLYQGDGRLLAHYGISN